MNRSPHNWIVILAAGASERFNGVKALAPWDKGTLLSHAIDTAHAVCGPNVVVVTGCHTDVIKPTLNNVKHVFNAKWQLGMGASIVAGAKHVLDLDDQADCMVVMPVDQPFITADHLQALIDKTHETGSCTLTGAHDSNGPPACVPASSFALLVNLDGQQGLKSALKRVYDTIINDAALKDIDTQQELIVNQ